MQRREPTSMLNDTQNVALAAELNHLLWTNDPPEITPDVAACLRDDPGMEFSGVNMQCAAHSVVCAGLMLRLSEKVTTRGGSALVVYPEQKQFEKPFVVMKHWWISNSLGLCDFSLNLGSYSAHKPIIYRNRNVADLRRRISFRDDFRQAMSEAEESHAARIHGVFY